MKKLLISLNFFLLLGTSFAIKAMNDLRTADNLMNNPETNIQDIRYADYRNSAGYFVTYKNGWTASAEYF